MKSQIVKLNKTGFYFKVYFSLYNTIEKLEFKKNRDEATIFQEDSNILTNSNGEKLKIGGIRCKEFSYLCYKLGIKKEDITVETLYVPEQDLLTKQQQKILVKHSSCFCKPKKRDFPSFFNNLPYQ